MAPSAPLLRHYRMKAMNLADEEDVMEGRAASLFARVFPRIWARLAVVVSLTLLAGSTCRAQNVPPPPKPKDSGPSLEVTMKYIQEKLNAQGVVSWMVRYRNTEPPGASPWAGNISDPTYESEEAADATTDLKGCSLNVRFKTTSMSKQTINSDQKASISFKDIAKLEVMTLQEEYQRYKVFPPGNPNIRAEVSPDTSVVVLSLVNKPGSAVDFKFQDPQMADRMAKAMLHATELCGGGENDPFK
jgi:hypothetical protein